MGELINEIKKRINVYHDRELENNLLEWVADNYSFSEVYPEENLLEWVADNYSFSEVYPEKDLLEWVADNYSFSEVYPEENWKIANRLSEIKKILKGEL